MITKIIGTATTGKCVYDLPEEIKTLEEMRALIYGTYTTRRPRKNCNGSRSSGGLTVQCTMA